MAQGSATTPSTLSRTIPGGADGPIRRDMPADLSGQSFGEFTLIRRLGQGGMGQVYLAEQTTLNRRVALKLLRPELVDNEISRQRFEAEARAVARMNHANIVQVFAVGSEDELPYMALEYVDGRNLRDYVARRGPVELPVALSIIHQTVSALQRAAELGIMHRDIKPENILMTRRGEVKIADFGLSRVIDDDPQSLNLTQTGTTMGTPLYMSPEQVEGKPLDCRTDIYSLGVTCYHMLTGQPPFQGDNAFSVAIQHVKGKAVPLSSVRPDLPLELCGIVAKMMARKPKDRYGSPKEILKDMERFREKLSAASTQMMPISPEMDEAFLPVNHENQILSSGLQADDLDSTILELPVSNPGRIRFRVALAVLSVLAAIIIGWAAGSLLSPSVDWDSLVEQYPAEEFPEFAFIESDAEYEAALRTLVQTTRSPGEDSAKLRRGVQHRLDLGLLLLDLRRTDPEALRRAAKFFDEMVNTAVPDYVKVGEVGNAIVLAFQDQWAESNEQFMKLRPDFRRAGSPLRNRDLLRYVGAALDHNHANNPEEFPRQLQRFRRPGGALANPQRRRPGRKKDGPMPPRSPARNASDGSDSP